MTRFGASAVAVAVLLALSGISGANAPELLEISVDLALTGQTSAVGTFSASGAIVAEGTAEQEWFLTPDPANPRVTHGIKTLTSEGGTLTILFVARLMPDGDSTIRAVGRFVVLEATGDFEGVQAAGETYAEFDVVSGTITGTYVGFAH